jgi:hypothetical protein
MRIDRGSLVRMPTLTRADYDAALAEAIDSVPERTLMGLGDAVIRVEQAPRHGGLETVPGLRLVVYREPSLSQASDRDELRRLARADLVRALVWELDIPEARAEQLASLAPAAR